VPRRGREKQVDTHLSLAAKVLHASDLQITEKTIVLAGTCLILEELTRAGAIPKKQAQE